MNMITFFIIALLGGLTFIGVRLADAPTKVSVETTEDAVAQVRVADNQETSVEMVSVTSNMLTYSGKGLSKIPESIFKESSATTLDVSNNKLDGSLPAEVRHLQNLQVLNLSNNNFTGVPAEIGQLQKLEILNLSSNPITGLPLELGNLKNLQVLDLRDTQYSEYDLDIIRKSLPAGIEIKI